MGVLSLFRNFLNSFANRTKSFINTWYFHMFISHSIRFLPLYVLYFFFFLSIWKSFNCPESYHSTSQLPELSLSHMFLNLPWVTNSGTFLESHVPELALYYKFRNFPWVRCSWTCLESQIPEISLSLMLTSFFIPKCFYHSWLATLFLPSKISGKF